MYCTSTSTDVVTCMMGAMRLISERYVKAASCANSWGVDGLCFHHVCLRLCERRFLALRNEECSSAVPQWRGRDRQTTIGGECGDMKTEPQVHSTRGRRTKQASNQPQAGPDRRNMHPIIQSSYRPVVLSSSHPVILSSYRCGRLSRTIKYVARITSTRSGGVAVVGVSAATICLHSRNCRYIKQVRQPRAHTASVGSHPARGNSVRSQLPKLKSRSFEPLPSVFVRSVVRSFGRNSPVSAVKTKRMLLRTSQDDTSTTGTIRVQRCATFTDDPRSGRGSPLRPSISAIARPSSLVCRATLEARWGSCGSILIRGRSFRAYQHDG